MRKDAPSLTRDLKRLINDLVEEALAARKRHDSFTQHDREARILYLRRLLHTVNDLSAQTILPRRVFLSYSSATGATCAAYVSSILRDKHKCEVVTGFDKQPDDKANVLRRVLCGLKSVSLFVGIMTKDCKIRKDDGETSWGPSVWVAEEKGMALALGLPFAMLIDEDIDEDYWRKTTPSHVHFRFTGATFMQVADEAMEQLMEKLADRRSIYLGAYGADAEADEPEL